MIKSVQLCKEGLGLVNTDTTDLPTHKEEIGLGFGAFACKLMLDVLRSDVEPTDSITIETTVGQISRFEVMLGLMGTNVVTFDTYEPKESPEGEMIAVYVAHEDGVMMLTTGSLRETEGCLLEVFAFKEEELQTVIDLLDVDFDSLPTQGE